MHTVQGFIFDLDGTITDGWNCWADNTLRAHQRLADLHGITADQILQEITQLSVTQRFYDISAVLDLPCMQDKPDHVTQACYDKIIDDYNDDTMRDALFPGATELLDHIKSSGGKNIFYTDGSLSGTVIGLNKCNIDPDLIDLLAVRPNCRRDKRGAEDSYSPEEACLAARLKEKTFVLEDDIYTSKPCPAAVQKILDHTNLRPEQAVIIGDHAKDALSGHLPQGRVKFAWARYGTFFSADYLAFCQRAMCDQDYVLGEAHVKAEMARHNITPDFVLDRLDHVKNLFDPSPAVSKSAHRACPK